MTRRIGLYVGGDRLTAVAVARRAIVWHASVERLADIPLDIQLDTLMQGVPRKRFSRTTVFVALGPAITQLKHLRGLPPVAAPRVIRQLMEGTPSRFFLVGADSPVIAEPERSADGWWVAVADAQTIVALDAICAHRGWRQGGTRPVAALLDRALAGAETGRRICWRDGDVSLDISYGTHGIASLKCTSTSYTVGMAQTSSIDEPLAALATDAWRFAGAYAAARAGGSAPLAFRRQSSGDSRPRRTVFRIASFCTLAAGLAVTLGAPAILAAHVQKQNERALNALRAQASSVARDRVALEQQQAALRQVRAFVESRRLVTPLLSALSVQLPESTAIVALHLDTLGGTMNALSPVGAELVQSVSATPGVDGLQLNAPITREGVGSLELQRTALRFRFKKRAMAPPRKHS